MPRQRRTTVREFQDSENEANIAEYRGFVERQEQRAEPKPPELQIASEDVRRTADALIANHYNHLDEAHIIYVMESKDRRQAGRPLLGRAIKLNPLQRFLECGKESVEMGADFALVLNRVQWDAHAEPRWREACIDELLAACGADVTDEGNRSYKLNKPDFAGYLGVLERQGAWRTELEQMRETAMQMPLFAAANQ